MSITPLRLLAILYPCLSIVGQYPLGGAQSPLSLERLVMLGLGPFCALQLLTGGPGYQRLVRFTPRSLLVGIGLWVLAIMMSFIINHNAASNSVLSMYLQKIALGTLFAFAVASEPDARRAVRVYAYSAGAAAIATFYVFQTIGSGAIRSASFVNVDHGNVSLIEGLARAGAIGSIPLLACWLEAVFAKVRWKTVCWYGTMGMLFAASLLALRREYLVSNSLCLIWGAFTLPLGLRKIWLIGVVGALFALGYSILLIVPEWNYRLFSETVETFSQRQDPRMLMLQTAPGLFSEHPLFGYGLGSYPMLMASHLPLNITAPDEAAKFFASGLPSHNSFLTAGIEMGVIGFFGLVTFFYALGLWSVRIWRANRVNRGSPLALFAPVFFIQILSSVVFGDGLVNNLVWSFIGLQVAIIAIERAKMFGAAHRPGAPGVRGRRGPSPQQHVRIPRLG